MHYLQKFVDMVANERTPMVCLSLHMQRIKGLAQGRKKGSISRLKFFLQESLSCSYLLDLYRCSVH